MRTKIKNIINDLHWKTCHYLCSNFKTILLPTFDVTKMTRKLPSRIRKINSTTTRNMLTLCHYKFKQRLLYKASATGTNVHLCNESYTTKTCGNVVTWKIWEVRKFSHVPNVILKLTVITMEPGIFT